jgi:hypothetical protein
MAECNCNLSWAASIPKPPCEIHGEVHLGLAFDQKCGMEVNGRFYSFWEIRKILEQHSMQRAQNI